ncbi:hypothetical protein CS8_084240 [Cupriavidus sp. 8B]
MIRREPMPSHAALTRQRTEVLARRSIAALITPALVLIIPAFALVAAFRALVAAPVLPVATALIIATRPRIARRPYAATKCNCDQNQRQIPSTFHSTLLVERSHHWSHGLKSRTPGAGLCGRVMGTTLLLAEPGETFMLPATPV